MFSQKTVFVLGAGASEEIGFPLGITLRDKIRSQVKLADNGLSMQGPARNILIHFANQTGQGRESVEAAQRIESGLQYFASIDDFLDHRRDDPLLIKISKMVIAQLILEYEAKCPLNRAGQEQRVGDIGLTETWYFKFVKMLVKDRPRSKIADLFDNVTFITYNYDRSVQQYLMWAIAEACDVPVSEAITVVNGLSIHHVYGSLGNLPELSRGYSVGFGNARPAAELAMIAENIRTYTESMADSGEQALIQDAVRNAKKLIFLGCGYHKQNLEILRPGEGLSDCEIIGTIYGASIKARSTICDRLAALYAPEPIPGKIRTNMSSGLHDSTCTELFSEYSLGFTG